jgi:hypothetical protein
MKEHLVLAILSNGAALRHDGPRAPDGAVLRHDGGLEPPTARHRAVIMGLEPRMAWHYEKILLF